ncbi:MAG: hypothetical protein EBR40_11090 [Proteobacteria bacterium]|nr:hypothetical protein [Pseudomonadota bacterium]
MPLDNPVQREGDSGFLGMASRLNPLQLKEGMVQLAENMRLDRGVAQTRKGAKRLADAIAAGETELVLDFTLGADISVTSITRSGSTATVTTATPHGETVGQIINLRGAVQAEYNGDFAVGTVPTSTTFTITVSGTPATPATGTITLNGGPVVRSTYSGGVFQQASTPLLASMTPMNTSFSRDRMRPISGVMGRALSPRAIRPLRSRSKSWPVMMSR